VGEITLAVAVLAGLGSFVAPCILPMIPAFLAYISGSTLSELNQKGGSQTISINRTKIIINTVFFVLGFSVVFSTLGVIINSTLTSSSGDLIEGFSQVGGIIIIGFGAFVTIIKNKQTKHRKEIHTKTIQS
jgi:cytochrome c-type biogenesis protein